MRSTLSKTAAVSPAATPVRKIVVKGGGDVAPMLRRTTGLLVPGPRKSPQGRRVRDLAPGEQVPGESRIVFRAGVVSRV